MEIILSLIIRTLMKSTKSSLLQILHKTSKDNCGVFLDKNFIDKEGEENIFIISEGFIKHLPTHKLQHL